MEMNCGVFIENNSDYDKLRDKWREYNIILFEV